MSAHDGHPATAAGTTTAPAGTQPAGQAPAPAGRGNRGTGGRARRRWPIWVAGLTVAALAGAGCTWWWQEARAASGDGDRPEAVATATTEVARRTLSSTEEVDGTLGYADAGSGQLAFGRQGTVTWLPEEGTTLGRGATAYKVDDQPVPLLYGTLPPYRDLAYGVDDGRDVEQLEKNLELLGYDPGTIDQHFSAATREAVEDWQEALGVDETGQVRRGDVALAPGPIRVAERSATVGGAAGPGQPALKVTATAREVAIDLPADKQSMVAKGDKVQITLPSGQTIPGKVIEVSRVATTNEAAQGQEGETTVGVTVTLDDPKAAGSLDQAPVRVAITTETVEDALAVPVHALLALAEGGYAVEVDSGGARRLVRVEPGLFAEGLVEVTGEGLREGMRVVVPA